MTRQKEKKKKKAVKGQKIEKLWGLEPKTFSRGSRYFIDQDYAGELSKEEKAWLSKFNEEYYGNKVKKKDSLHLDKLKNYDKRKKKFKTAKRKIMKTLYDATNARNRDLHTVNYKIYDDEKRVSEDQESLFDLSRKVDYNVIEDTTVDYIAFKNLMERYLKQGFTEEQAREKAIVEFNL